jgi:putative membrane protein
MMFWYDHDMTWWGYASMGVGMVLFWGLLITGIVVLIRYATVDQQRSPKEASPEQVLAGRFARGEISDTEYRDRLAVLRDHSHP